MLFQTLAYAAGRTLFLWTEALSHLRRGFAATMFTLAAYFRRLCRFGNRFWQAILSIRKTRIQISLGPP
jgi:hypothetical protein